MGTTICRGIFHNFGVANIVRISKKLWCQNYNIMTTHTMNIAIGNNEELAYCQLLQVSNYIVQNNAFRILTKKYMEILRKYA